MNNRTIAVVNISFGNRPGAGFEINHRQYCLRPKKKTDDSFVINGKFIILLYGRSSMLEFLKVLTVLQCFSLSMDFAERGYEEIFLFCTSLEGNRMEGVTKMYFFFKFRGKFLQF